jgi:hypothetical protein
MTSKNIILQHTLHWLARVISTLAAVFWFLILLDIIACDVLVGFVCMNWEIALLIGVVVFSILSVIIAWRRERIGGIIVFLWGLAFSVIAIATSTNQRLFSVLVSGVPFIIAGLLFVASSWWRVFGGSNRNRLGNA